MTEVWLEVPALRDGIKFVRAREIIEVITEGLSVSVTQMRTADVKTGATTPATYKLWTKFKTEEAAYEAMKTLTYALSRRDEAGVIMLDPDTGRAEIVSFGKF